MSTVLPAVNSNASVLPRSSVGGTLASSTADESQDRFLKLLVTQMRNQDPMNPMDNAQVTTQLAQISTVGGIDKLNNSLSAMSSAMSATQNASLIGRNVVVSSDLVRLGSTGPVTVGVELAGAADKVGVAIQDASGRTVRSLSFGALPQGTSTFEWDGRNDAGERVAAGDYSLRLNATNASRAVVASGLVAGYVDSVTVQGGSSLLNLRGLGAADVAQVRRID
ncbi:MAG: flagellar hook assembly protein FlgD [Pseudomonadota bacterium]